MEGMEQPNCPHSLKTVGGDVPKEPPWLLDNYPDLDCLAEGIFPRELGRRCQFRRHSQHAEMINCLISISSVTVSSAPQPPVPFVSNGVLKHCACVLVIV